MNSRKTRLLAAVVATTAFGSASAIADVHPRLTISPSAPRVNQSVKIAFHSPHALRAGHIYSVVIRGEGHCKSSAAKFDIVGPKPTNARLVVVLKPTAQIGPKKLHRWCRGNANAKVVESSGTIVVGTVAVREFHFRGTA